MATPTSFQPLILLRRAGAGSVRAAGAWTRRMLGGRARAQVIVLFACVLGLDTADLSSLGAVAGQLKLSLHIDNTELGLLAAAPALVTALVTLPLGILADRVKRIPLLAAAVGVWSVAMLACGASQSFTMLLIVRLALGAATAAAAPLIASLVGDLFDPRERGRIYGYIVGGELLGSMVGLLIVGNLAAFSWRAALWVLALPCVGLAVLIWRTLPEPARGGASRLQLGAEEIPLTPSSPAGSGPDAAVEPHATHDPEVQRAVRQEGAEAIEEHIIDRDPAKLTLVEAVRYVLSIRTNVLLILSSSLGYFFLAGVQTFGVVFIASQFKLGQSESSSLLAAVALGALGGTVLGGRIADRLLGRGHAAARILVGGVGYCLSVAIFVPGLLSSSLALAVGLYFLAAASLAAPNAALDAARLDIVPARLRGRAESVRTVLRTLCVALAPLVFGFVSDQLASGPRTATKGIAYSVSAQGLKYTFLLMLVPLAAAGTILLRGRRDYVRDVATAVVSEQRIAEREQVR